MVKMYRQWCLYIQREVLEARTWNVIKLFYPDSRSDRWLRQSTRERQLFHVDVA